MELSENEQGQGAEKRRKTADDHNSDEDSDEDSGEGAGEESNASGEGRGEDPGEDPGEGSRELIDLAYESDDEPAFVDFNDFGVAAEIFGMAYEHANEDEEIWYGTPEARDYAEDHRLTTLQLPPIGRPIPEILLQLDALRELRILDPEIGRIPNFIPRWFGRMTSLRVLGIHLNDSSVLPEEISELHNLESLTVRADGGVTFPGSFGNLSELKEMRIEKGDQRPISRVSFPTSIGQRLANLTKLYISVVEEFPEEICSFTSLEHLTIEDFHGTYPASISRLTNLRFLTIRTFDLRTITNLPDEIGNLTNLERMNLLSTTMSTFPSTMTKLQNLRDLLLGSFESISAGQEISNLVESLPRLEVLEANPFQKNLPKATVCAFRRIVSRNRARKRLGFLGSTDGGPPFPPSLWPLILKQATLAFDTVDHWAYYYYHEPENKSQPDAIFHLLVNYGTTILQKK